MREQPSILENVADASSLRRHVDPSLGIEQDGTVEYDAAGARRKEAADDVPHRAFAAAGTSERGNSPGGPQFEMNAQGERANPGFSRDGKHQRPNMRRTRRANH